MRRRTRSTTLPIGVISEGTLRPEDLIPACLSALEDIRVSAAERKTLRDISRRYHAADEGSEYWDVAADDDLNDLQDIMENHTPDYCYYGSSEGDGACFGVFPIGELFTDTHQGGYDGYVWRGTREDVPIRLGRDQYSHVLEVNDHGNATLWRRAGRRWIEVWAVV